MNILLLDAHTVQSISVARSLKENGHVIFGFIESRLSYGYVSRFVDHKILCPILRDAPSEYLNFLVDFSHKLIENPYFLDFFPAYGHWF